MRIRKFWDYIREVSGTELVGRIGPAYGDVDPKNNTINSHDTHIIYCELDGNFWTMDMYNDAYHNYLKSGGKPLGGFNINNILSILSHKK
jgi:hypothetical protein